MKKIISVLMCVTLVFCCVFAVTGCTKKEDLKSDIVLITDGRTVKDGGYNQSAWEGISSYADENSMKCSYYQPVLDEEGNIASEDVEKYVELAAENGAQFVVLPGEKFAVSAYEIAPAYPDINFILVDAMPHPADSTTDALIQNVMSIQFNALQSGFLAGYISVMNGNTELGYFGQFDSKTSANYGAGFVQGAAYAADSLGIPATVDWADYDSALIDYNYNFTITACYEKVEDQDEKTFKVTVENGQGSGTYTEGSNVTITADPAPLGQEFDCWVVKSNTEGVKDKKVNISSKTKSSMNLLVEKCDCTITATYKDVEGAYCSVTVLDTEGKDAYSVIGVAENGNCTVKAPAAPQYMVFDHWESSVEEAVENGKSAETKVNVTNQDIVLTPVYRVSEDPAFYVTVETGEGGEGTSTGTGSYLAGDVVEVSAAVPKDGYMFSHWENKDAYNQGTGIAMENEYYPDTTFSMVDRYAAVCETMYDHGVTAIFAGGNDKTDSVFTAKGNFDYNLNVITAGENNGDAYTTIVNNYGEAIKDCLADFKGAGVFMGSCENEDIYATFVSEDDEIKAKYDEIYKALASGEIKTVAAEGGAGYDFCQYFNTHNMSKCLTLNGIFLEGVSLPQE